MRKIYLLLLTVLFAATINAQSSASYSFSTNNNGTLSADLNANVVDMSTGTTQLIAPGLDAAASSVTTIPFDFYFMGTKFTQFSVNEDGVMQLGGTVVGTNMYTISGGTAAQPRLAAFNTDLRTGTNGKVHYKITGSAPNRALVVEFQNMQLFYTSSAAAGTSTFQMRLYESTGVIEYVYGTMSTTDVTAGNRSPSIGFYTAGTTGAFASIAYAAQTNSTTSPYTANPAVSVVGPITDLTSAADGSRRYYKYTPPVPATPTTFTFTSVGVTAMTLNWTDNSTSEYNFLVLRSTDNITFTQIASVPSTTSAGTGTVYSSVQSGLASTTTYYWRVIAVSEGATSVALNGSQITASCSLAAGTKTVGPTGNYLTLTAAVADVNLNGLTGPMILELQSTYTGAGETFPIVINPPCASAVNTLTIRPEAAVASTLTIAGSNTTAIIDLNGGSYVTIDGRPGGAGTNKFLTISNTSTATGGTAIRFINEASNNTVKFAVVKSLFPSTSSGVIVFSTTTGANGNDNNTINNCNIDGGAAATASPTLTATNGIFSAGTTSTAAANNSGNTVSSCNIFDFFNAGNASNGISISSGNTDWTITGNNLYQTATRTTTASNQYTGILINNTSGNNFTVNNNFIGGSTVAAGGTAWTISNITFTNRFVGIQLTAGTTTASNVQGNTITNFSTGTNSSAATTNGNFSGIWSSGGNVNIGTTAGNTIGSTTATGAITVTLGSNSGGTANLISYSGTGVVDIRNNTVGGITLIGATATIGEGYNGILVSGGTPTITGNTIGNNTTANSINSSTVATGTQTLTGIQVTSGATGIATISNNIVANVNQSGTGTASFNRGILYGGTGFCTMTSNTVHDLSGASANTTVAGGATAIEGIIYTGGSVGGLVTLNTVYALSATNTGAVSTVVAGIGYSNPTSGIVTRNKVYDLRNASTGTTATAPPMAVGLLIRAALTDGTFSNNMISLGNGQTTNTQFVGIMNSFLTNTVKVYFNSINIEGTASAGALPSFGFLRGDNSATAVVSPVDIRNNIFTNTRSGGTGKHYAIGNNYGATASTTGWGANASNNNLLNANAATVGYWTSDRTFTAWQTAASSDAASVTAQPVTYVNAATADLHLNMGVTPTAIESGGVAIAGITVDYDNQVRPGPAGSVNGGALAPDLGADEIDGVILDIVGPTIVYTPLGYTCSSTARTLTATITDINGVPTSGPGLPVLYWKINAGAYTPATATSLGGNQYQFSFGAGAVAGDVVSYYIAAQDIAPTPNVSVFPAAGATGFSINPPAASTPPTTPSTYTISAISLSGTYNVGIGQTYITLTAAVAAYNAACITGPVVFQLMDATYPTETFPITINANPFASSTNTLTIRPAASISPVITGSNAAAIIKVNGGDYVTIDGSNSGGTTRNLTIINTNTGTSSIGVWFASTTAGDGATNNTIKNCIVSGNATNTTLACIVTSGSAAGGVAEAPNSSNTIRNNAISTSFYGIAMVGPTVNETGNIIADNTIGSAVTLNKIGLDGIGIFQQQGVLVTNNTILGINSTVTGAGSSASGIAVLGTASGGLISGNIISDIKKAGAWGVNGIQLNASNNGVNMTISNNIISDVASGGFASGVGIDDNGYGIAVNTGSGYNIYYNTVNLTTDQSTGTSAAFWISSSITAAGALDVRDNIFSNKQTLNNRFAIYSNNASNTIFSNIDYNDYYTAGTNLGFIGSNRVDLAAIQAGFGGNTHSTSAQPVFVSATNFHLSNANGANWCLNGSGIVIPGITTDIDGDTRSTGVAPNGPDMGADEFVAVGDAVATPASQTICSGATITTIVLSGTATSYNWTRNNTGSVTGIAASGSGNISGALTNTTAAPVTVTFTITPVNAGGCFGPTITATVIVNPTPNAVATPSSQTICSGATITTIALTGGVSGTTYNWTRDNTGSVTGIAASGSGNISGSLTNTTSAPVTVTFTITPTANSCPGTPITATVIVNPSPDAVATPSSQTICSGNAITTIALTGGVSGSTLNWTRDNTGSVTGIAASGSGDISGSLTNTTSAPVTVTFTITATANSCPGTPITATVIVNPIPDAVATPSSQSACSGNAITTIALTGSVGSTTFNWTRDNPGITGIANSGSGNISGTLTNTTASPVTVTFTITPTANGCPGAPITATVIVNPLPVISDVTTQPSTCVAADGAIDITVSNAAGPYTYAWSTVGGSGLTPGAEDQSGLTIGQYTVVVTAANSCTATAVFNLVGPGGCAVCPVIGSLTTTPSGVVCNGSPVTLTASGLTFMGITYGITFKYSTSALADPYAGGTVIATVPNGSLTGGGTTATTTTTLPGAGNYFIYAILSPVPIDPACRPSAQASLVVPQSATVNAVPNQTVCNGGPTAPVTFTGAIPGTVYNWVNNTPGIGLAGSGTGNIPSFNGTNAGNTPLTGTITVTPSYTTLLPNVTQTFSNTGAMQTWTVPAGVTSITIDAYGAQGADGAAGGNASAGGTGGAGSKASGTLAVTPGQVLNIFVGGAGTSGTGGYNGGGNGGSTSAGGGGGASDVRYPGTAASDRIIVAGGGGGGGRGGCESVIVTGGNGGVGGNGNGVNGTDAPTPGGFAGGGFGAVGTTFGAAGIGCGGFLGQPGASGAGETGGTGGTGQACCCFSAPSVPGGGGGGGGYLGGGGGGGGSAGTAGCSGNDKGGGGGGAGGSSYTGGVTTGSIVNGSNAGDGSIVISYSAGSATCAGTPTTFTITVNPTPTVNTVTNQTVCNGSPTAAVNFSGAAAGTTYNWINNTTSIGLAASGTGNIASFTATNATNAPVTATVTVTPSYTNGSNISSQSFSNTGAMQTWTVPAGVTSITIDAYGAQGADGAAGGNASSGGTGGAGSKASGTLAVTPGQVLNIFVGGAGTSGTGGYNGGANGGSTSAGGGGGASDVRYPGTSAANRIIVAGGGGGGGRGGCESVTVTGGNGGAGGNGNGVNGTDAPTPGGFAGGGFGAVGTTFGAAGIGCGGFLGQPGVAGSGEIGGAGGAGQACCCFSAPSVPGGGGGGGGYLGGGGGGGGSAGTVGCSGNDKGGGGGGAGGSSYTGGVTAGSIVNGSNSGDGSIVITYAMPVTCTGAPTTFTITVNPTPNAVATPASQTICSASAITTIVMSGNVSGTTYNWTRNNTATVTGIAASGSGNISGTLTNTTAAPVTVTFTITPTANGCPGTPITATVLVNPTPNAVATPASQTVCSANAITTIVLSGNVSGTTYNWTRDNTVAATGIAASGSGNISGTLTNTTNAPVTVTFTITPTANGCPGAPITATVLLNPTPNAVATPSTQTVCSGPITTIVLTGNVSGTTFNWTRNNTVNVTGIAASGSGNISGSVTNTTSVQQTVTFTITPTANGCPGAPITATVIVNPAPTVTCPANVTVNNTVGQCGANVTYPPATATGTPAPTISYSNPSGSFFPVGVTTVTVTATNSCGTATCTFTVTVLDVQAPVITCPSNITATTPVGSCTASVVNPNPTTSDNCAVTLQTWTLTGATTGSSPATGINNVGTRAFNLGVTTVTYTIKDASGNTATCSYTVTVLDGQLPVISVQPANRTVCATTTATFSVTATNVVSYQWQAWDGAAWNNIAGATSSTLTLTNVTVSMNTNSYRVILTGLCTVVTSNFATLYVNRLPTIALTAVPFAAIQPGQTTTIVATTNPSGGTFVWFKNGVIVPGATGSTLGPLGASDIGTYRAVYTDPNGCVSTSADIVISAQVSTNLWVYPNPNHGQFQVRFFNTVNEVVTLSVLDDKGALVYQRKYTTSAPYTQMDVVLGEANAAGTYVVEIKDASGKQIGARRIVVLH